MNTTTITYQKVWDDNETQTEARNGRIHESVVGWVYEFRVNGEYADVFCRLKDVKRAYPTARRRPSND
jgi:hypothetical protein